MEDKLKNIKTLTELLDYRANYSPDKIAYYFHKSFHEFESITYLELQQRAHSLAHRILKSAKPGDRALLVLEPGLDFIITFFATLYAGVIAVPIYPPADKTLTQKMQHVIEDCKPQILLSTIKVCRSLRLITWLFKIKRISCYMRLRFSLHYPQLNLDSHKIKLVAVNKNFKKIQKNLPLIDENKLAFLQYSSGSTGEPKGIMLTHFNLVENSRLIHNDIKSNENSRGVIWLPPYHDMGLIGGILQPLYAGFFVALMSPINFIKNPKLWFELITHYKANITGGPNFCYAYTERILKNTDLAKIDLSSLRYMFNGAEPVKAKTMEAFVKKFSLCGFRYEMFFPCYGLAEATLYVTAHHANKKTSLLAVEKEAYAEGKIKIIPDIEEENDKVLVLVAAGKVQNGVAIYNADNNTFANENRLGEIIIHNACVSQGYWNKPELNKEIFNDIKINGKTYLKTGDLGFIHNNLLFISGRSKDVIIVRGKNYYPHDLEEVAQLILTFIRPGGCVAIEDPDHAEHVLFIAEVSDNQIVEPEQYIRLAKSISSSYGLHVSSLVLVPRKSIPKTTSGKLRRFLCKKMYVNHEFIIKNVLD